MVKLNHQQKFKVNILCCTVNTNKIVALGNYDKVQTYCVGQNNQGNDRRKNEIRIIKKRGQTF